MKRYILYALSIITLCSCTIESAEKSEYSEAGLQRFASEVADDKLIFPMSILETVLLIDDYERMSAEEKVELGHIFNNLIKSSDKVYSMKDFYNLKVSTDGKSIYEDGAEWMFQTDYSMYGYESKSFALCNNPEGAEHDFILDPDVKGSPQTEIRIDSIEKDDAYFSWEIEVEGWFTSGQGRDVRYITDGPLIRKVTRSSDSVAESMVTMNGRLVITIFDTDGTELDEVTYSLSGTKVNPYYQF